MEIVVLPCHLPLPAIRVVNRNATKQLTFDHVFVRSEELPVMFDDLPAILVVNVEPKETSIGITVGMMQWVLCINWRDYLAWSKDGA